MRLPTPQELIDFRKSLRLSQKAMGERFGLGRSTYANYEDGIARFQPEHYETLVFLGWGREKHNLPDALVRAMAFGGTVSLPLRTSVFAGDPQQEEIFDDELGQIEVPLIFLAHDPEMKGEYETMIVSGESMVPRLMPDDVLIVMRAPSVPDGALVAARDPDGKVYIKTNRYDVQRDRKTLASVNGKYPTIDILTDWVVVGGVIGIWKRSVTGAANMEYQLGRWLRA